MEHNFTEESYNERRRELEKRIEIIMLEDLLEKPVICLSNEINNLRVGIGKEIIFITKAQTPMLILQDVVSGKEFMPMGLKMAFTAQKFDALNSIEPNARIALFYNQQDYYDVDKTPTQKEEIIDPNEWALKVYDGLNKYLKNKNNKPGI